ncbi:MAG: dATP/dGTP diphosphohydrolase domain-containing protein [Egibacteraceae bacterium]
MSYDPREQKIVLDTFGRMLAAATGDGGKKRARGEKPPWWRDPSHEAAIFSHLSRWKHGEKRDPDSGAHPLVHLAWRALAVAWVEMHGEVPPVESAVDQESGRPYHEECRPPKVYSTPSGAAWYGDGDDPLKPYQVDTGCRFAPAFIRPYSGADEIDRARGRA